MSVLEMGFALYCLLSGIAVGWVWASAPLKRKVEELVEELRWKSAQAKALELDLQRVREKLAMLPPQRKATKQKR